VHVSSLLLAQIGQEQDQDARRRPHHSNQCRLMKKNVQEIPTENKDEMDGRRLRFFYETTVRRPDDENFRLMLLSRIKAELKKKLSGRSFELSRPPEKFKNGESGATNFSTRLIEKRRKHPRWIIRNGFSF
jgi:hypothetical protein